MTDPRFIYINNSTLRVYASIKSRIQVHISPFQLKYRLCARYRIRLAKSLRKLQ